MRAAGLQRGDRLQSLHGNAQAEIVPGIATVRRTQVLAARGRDIVTLTFEYNVTSPATCTASANPCSTDDKMI